MMDKGQADVSKGVIVFFVMNIFISYDILPFYMKNQNKSILFSDKSWSVGLRALKLILNRLTFLLWSE